MAVTRHSFTHARVEFSRLLVGLVLLCLTSVAWPQTYNWYPVDARWGRVTGAADQSDLNEPITPAHALAVNGRHFVSLGADMRAGTPDDKRVRLFGINLGRDACFPPEAKAREVATTLRSLGFNAVRLHQMDAAPTSDTSVFRSTLTEGPYPTFHEPALKRLKHFLAELKAQGIYVNLNLMVGYVFRPDIDRVPALDAAGKAPGYGSPVHVFFPKMVELQAEHARLLLARLNLKDDPVLAQVEIINETSLAAAWLHWDKAYWETQITGTYAAELDAQWVKWVERKHGSMTAACQAWRACADEPGHMLTPRQADGLQHATSAGWWVKLKQKFSAWWHAIRSALGLPRLPYTPGQVHPKVADALQFVTDTDRQFLNHMRQVVRAATRADLPVTGTQMDFGAPLNFHSHRDMDYVDAHFYVDHPMFPRVPWSDTDWHYSDESVSGRAIDDLLHLSLYRDAGKPFVVSEFNQPYPNTAGHDILPATAAFAAQQDWDGLYFFAYGGTDENHVAPAHFFLQGDWSKASVVGLAARMFRTGSVPRLDPYIDVTTAETNWWFSAANEGRPDTWSRFLTHRHGWNTRSALKSAVGMGPKPAVSSASSATPALTHAADERRLLIQTPKVNAIMGEVAGKHSVNSGQLTVALESPEPRERTAALLHSLDDQPIATSRHLLLALPAPLTGSSGSVNRPAPQQRIPHPLDRGKWTLAPAANGSAGTPSGSRGASPPAWVHRSHVKIAIGTNHKRATVYPLTTQGQRMQPLNASAISQSPTGLTLNIAPTQTPLAWWYEVVFE